MKTYRRFIRHGNRLISSPRFSRRADAEQWYHEMRRKKQFVRDGIVVDDRDDSIKFIEYSRRWIQRRMKDYPEATWKSDEQRLRSYILPLMSELPISSITSIQIRSVLLKISEEGFLKEGFTISTETRNRVKALLSAIFSDALNEDPPIVQFNPVAGLKIKEKRRGKKKPRTLSDADECLRFISSAKKLGWEEYVIASTFLMSGLRKQELIALRWGSFDSKARTLKVSEKYEQASNSIKAGTKAGEHHTRIVPISHELASILREHKTKVKFTSPDDFIVCRPDGRFYGGRDISTMVERIRTQAGIDISAHGLRHTFGRHFVAQSGNVKALQAILGHSSSSTTDLYSELSGNRLKGFGDVVEFSIGVKESEK